MARQIVSAGTPILLALVIVSVASFGARYYHDHKLVPMQQQAQIAAQK